MMLNVNERAAIGGNNPPHKIALMEAEYFAERCSALQVRSQADAEKALLLMDEEVKSRKAATLAHEQEKAPYLQRGREVDVAWKPVICLYQDAVKVVKARASAFQQAERERIAKEAEAARLEAERLQEEAMAALAAKQAPEADEWDKIAADMVVDQSDAATERASALEAQAIARPQLRAEGVNARSMKTIWSAEVLDARALVIALADNPAVQAEAIKIANQMARVMKSGFQLAGCQVKSEETF
jgi:hypothetical protein